MSIISGDMTLYTGTYVGTGVAHAISGWGFLPYWSMVKAAASTYGQTRGYRFGTKRFFATATNSNRILKFHDDGIYLGTDTDVNLNAGDYYSVGFGLKSGSLLGVKAVVGSYTGDGNDGHQILGLNLDPDFLIIRSGINRNGMFKTDQHTGTVSSFFHNGADDAVSGIKSLTADGFTLGTGASVNSLGEKYYYLALQKHVDGASKFMWGAFYRDGNTSYDRFYETGIRPDWLAVFPLETLHPAMSSAALPDGESQYFIAAGANFTTGATELQNEGFFAGNSSSFQPNTTELYYIAIETDTEPDRPSSSSVGSSSESSSATPSSSSVGASPESSSATPSSSNSSSAEPISSSSSSEGCPCDVCDIDEPSSSSSSDCALDCTVCDIACDCDGFDVNTSSSSDISSSSSMGCACDLCDIECPCDLVCDVCDVECPCDIACDLCDGDCPCDLVCDPCDPE